MQDKIVSILTPSYNCGKYIHRLLDSVLKQTYPSIEMFVIDDGSVDDTKSLIQDYIPRFAERGYTLHYIHQENQGQSVAINNGLKLIKGDYLVWPDADDFYKEDDTIESLAQALEQGGEQVGMSRCLLEYLNEDDLSFIRAVKVTEIKDSLFEDCLFGTNGFWYCAGACMVKTSALREMIPGLEIYTEKAAGQNWQLMLPVLYKYKCATVPEVKYSVLQRSASHSRGQFTSRKQTNTRFNGYRNTILETLKKIPYMTFNELKSYSGKINAYYNRMIFKNNMVFFLGPLVPVIQRVKKLFKR